MSASTAPLRLYVSSDLGEGSDVPLTTEQVHYVFTVMRRKDGSPILLFNGRDGEWSGPVSQTGRKAASVRLEHQTKPQTKELDLMLLFAPVKRSAIDVIAQKATELGASTLWPVITTRSNADRVNTDRLTSIAIEAAEQSGRLSVPDIRAPVPLPDAVDSWPESQPLFVLDETGGGSPIADALTAEYAQSPDTAAFLIGPEGGFTQAELDLLRALPFSKAVSLGPRILRADTAALAALTCWQALCGDWRVPSA